MIAAQLKANRTGTISQQRADTVRVGLLTIPRELRDEILKDVLEQEDGIVLTKARRTKQPASSRQTAHSYWALSLTCKQLRDEADQVFYSSNRFEIEIWYELPQLPDRHIALITHLAFFVGTSLSSRDDLACFVEITMKKAAAPITISDTENEWKLSWSTLQRTTKPKPLFDEWETADEAKPTMRMIQQFLSQGRSLDMKMLEAVRNKLRIGWRSADLADDRDAQTIRLAKHRSLARLEAYNREKIGQETAF